MSGCHQGSHSFFAIAAGSQAGESPASCRHAAGLDWTHEIPQYNMGDFMCIFVLLLCSPRPARRRSYRPQGSPFGSSRM